MKKRRAKTTFRQATRLKANKFKVEKYLGISLGGGKNDRTCTVEIDFYPKERKLFLRQITEKIRTEGDVSADELLYSHILELGRDLALVGWDVPLKFPLCTHCNLKCPGFEKCSEEHIRWMWELEKELKKQKKSHKLFSPYIQRSVEGVVNYRLEEKFQMQPALGANTAPLTARAQFLLKRVKSKSVEVYAPLGLWRIGRRVGVTPKYLRFYKHSFEGAEYRHHFIRHLVDHSKMFIYQQDIQRLIDIPPVFDALISGLCAFLENQKQSEARPRGFPEAEAWISFPKVEFEWFSKNTKRT